jgi:hypothetical protein
MRPGHSAVFSAVFGMLFTWPAAGQENDASRKTLETMRRHIASLRAVSRPAQGGEELPLKLVTTPVLRYSDAGGITTDATAKSSTRSSTTWNRHRASCAAP